MLLISIIKKITFLSASTNKTLKTLSNSNFLTFKAELNFLQLKQVFTKFSIHNQFDLQYYFFIYIDALIYAINAIFSQLIVDFP